MEKDESWMPLRVKVVGSLGSAVVVALLFQLFESNDISESYVSSDDIALVVPPEDVSHPSTALENISHRPGIEPDLEAEYKKFTEGLTQTMLASSLTLQQRAFLEKVGRQSYKIQGKTPRYYNIEEFSERELAEWVKNFCAPSAPFVAQTMRQKGLKTFRNVLVDNKNYIYQDSTMKRKMFPAKLNIEYIGELELTPAHSIIYGQSDCDDMSFRIATKLALLSHESYIVRIEMTKKSGPDVGKKVYHAFLGIPVREFAKVSGTMPRHQFTVQGEPCYIVDPTRFTKNTISLLPDQTRSGIVDHIKRTFTLPLVDQSYAYRVQGTASTRPLIEATRKYRVQREGY